MIFFTFLGPPCEYVVDSPSYNDSYKTTQAIYSAGTIETKTEIKLK